LVPYQQPSRREGGGVVDVGVDIQVVMVVRDSGELVYVVEEMSGGARAVVELSAWRADAGAGEWLEQVRIAVEFLLLDIFWDCLSLCFVRGGAWGLAEQF